MRAMLVGNGRMGRALADALAARGHEVAARIGPAGGVPASGGDLAFEFTRAEAAPARVTELLLAGVPTVSGTTGWNPEHARTVASEKGVPFLWAPNFSLGVAALKEAVAAAARLLSPFAEFEPGILERHHAAKRDAPSGTARLLAQAAEDARPGRGTVPIVSLRHGGQPGEHVVVFEGPDEAVELVHRARSRAVFAAGAVRAAEWLLASGLRGPVTFDDFLSGRRA